MMFPPQAQRSRRSCRRFTGASGCHGSGLALNRRGTQASRPVRTSPGPDLHPRCRPCSPGADREMALTQWLLPVALLALSGEPSTAGDLGEPDSSLPFLSSPQAPPTAGTVADTVHHMFARKLQTQGLPPALPAFPHVFSLPNAPRCLLPPHLLPASSRSVLSAPCKAISPCVPSLPTFLSVAFKASDRQAGPSSLSLALLLHPHPHSAPLTVALMDPHFPGTLSLGVSSCSGSSSWNALEAPETHSPRTPRELGISGHHGNRIPFHNHQAWQPSKDMGRGSQSRALPRCL